MILSLKENYCISFTYLISVSGEYIKRVLTTVYIVFFIPVSVNVGLFDTQKCINSKSRYKTGLIGDKFLFQLDEKVDFLKKLIIQFYSIKVTVYNVL